MLANDNASRNRLAAEARRKHAMPGSAAPAPYRSGVRPFGFMTRVLAEAARVSSRTPLWVAAAGKVMERFDIGPYSLRLHFNAFSKKGYAYGLYQGALLAQRLGHQCITAIEFGVAGGNGLVALEALAQKIHHEVGIEVDVIGFDSGEGLPSTDQEDYRDLPYFWQKGFYKMDVEKLRKRLKRSRLVLGDIRSTLDPFIRESRQQNSAPIAFISFDLDYYSSTVAALRLFDKAGFDLLLPRTFVYFDDVIGASEELYNEYTGQLLAIREFNAGHDAMKLLPIRHLRGPFALNMYALHYFRHPDYCRFVGPKEQHLDLR
jgi:hypothetical protein